MMVELELHAQLNCLCTKWSCWAKHEPYARYTKNQATVTTPLLIVHHRCTKAHVSDSWSEKPLKTDGAIKGSAAEGSRSRARPRAVLHWVRSQGQCLHVFSLPPWTPNRVGILFSLKMLGFLDSTVCSSTGMSPSGSSLPRLSFSSLPWRATWWEWVEQFIPSYSRKGIEKKFMALTLLLYFLLIIKIYIYIKNTNSRYFSVSQIKTFIGPVPGPRTVISDTSSVFHIYNKINK